MGKIIKKRVEYGGSSNSAENMKYDDTKNVKEAIDEVKSELVNVNSNLTAPTKSRLLVSSENEISGFTYTAEKNGYVNYTFALSGSNSYAVLQIVKDGLTVNASQLSGCASSYSQILSLPILKGQKAIISYINAANNMLYFCEK